MRDLLTMQLLGRFGRAGNQIFQYMFLRTYADQHGLDLRLPAWDGTALFGTPEKPLGPGQRLPRVYERRSASGSHAPTRVHRNVEMVGFFQYHTSYYRPWAERIRQMFQPAPALRPALEAQARSLRPRAGPVVGVHLRTTDFGRSVFYLTPIRWYLDWLEAHWPVPSASLYVATDDPALRAHFARFDPLPPLQPAGLPSWFGDFHALSLCDILLMPNSTYSFAAALTGNPGMRVLRSDPGSRGFRPIDIWDSEPLRRDWRHEDCPERTDLWRKGRVRQFAESHGAFKALAARMRSSTDW
jgi:hypothetical protein